MNLEHKIDWLFDYEGAAQIMASDGTTLIDDANWRVTFDHVELGHGLRVVLTSADIRRDIDVLPRRDEPELWISGSVAVRGNVNIALADGNSADLNSCQGVLFSLSGKCARYRARAPQKLMIAGYVLREDRLLRMFGEQMPRQLIQLLDPEQHDPIIPLPVTPDVRRLAQRLFSTSLTGPLRNLYFEGAVGQLLSLQLASHAEQVASLPVLPGAERRAVEAARNMLLADMRNPPSLAELAERVGVREKALNSGFRALYGATAFELLRNERLEHARLAMEDGLALKVVAARVGYSHVANFVTAFAQRYGEPPGRYLRHLPR